MKFVVPTLIIALAGVAQANHNRTVEVTVTNASATQIMSPPVVLAHRRPMQLFQVGEPANAGVRAVAEDADAGPLLAMVEQGNNVVAHAVGEGPILPGHTATIRFRVPANAKYVTWVSMYVTTNDGFVGQTDIRVGYWTRSGSSPVYDAGTEANNELCDFIPGPPCGNPGVHAEDGAEGRVTVHRGIHGIGDLEPYAADWRNPGAYARVRRR